MIERYTRPEMGHLWSIENEWQQILNVEMAACDAMAELGEIPKEAAKHRRARAAFEVGRIHEIESVTHHDIIAFLTNVAEHVGDDSKYVHNGLTSSDVKDTAYCMMTELPLFFCNIKSRDIVAEFPVRFHRFHLFKSLRERRKIPDKMRKDARPFD